MDEDKDEGEEMDELQGVGGVTELMLAALPLPFLTPAGHFSPDINTLSLEHSRSWVRFLALCFSCGILPAECAASLSLGFHYCPAFALLTATYDALCCTTHSIG